EIPEAAADPRFKTMLDRMANAGECIALLDEVFARRPRAEWLRRLAAGGDFIYSIINSVDDLPDDPQMQANGYVTAFEHPAFASSEASHTAVPVRSSGSSARWMAIWKLMIMSRKCAGTPCRVASVIVGPGAIAFTRMLYRPTDPAMKCVIAFRAALVTL